MKQGQGVEVVVVVVDWHDGAVDLHRPPWVRHPDSSIDLPEDQAGDIRVSHICRTLGTFFPFQFSWSGQVMNMPVSLT